MKQNIMNIWIQWFIYHRAMLFILVVCIKQWCEMYKWDMTICSLSHWQTNKSTEQILLLYLTALCYALCYLKWRLHSSWCIHSPKWLVYDVFRNVSDLQPVLVPSEHLLARQNMWLHLADSLTHIQLWQRCGYALRSNRSSTVPQAGYVVGYRLTFVFVENFYWKVTIRTSLYNVKLLTENHPPINSICCDE